jgi:hypothetical protein
VGGWKLVTFPWISVESRIRCFSILEALAWGQCGAFTTDAKKYQSYKNESI